MKNLTFVFLLGLIPFVLKGQSQCDSITAGNEPPGCRLCGSLFFGSTKNYTPTNITSLPSSCDSIENNQFVSFIADSSGVFRSTIRVDFCKDTHAIESVIYDQTFTPVSPCFLTDNDGSIFSYNLIPGEVYWLMIDGYKGAKCEFRFIITSGFTFNEPNPENPLPPKIRIDNNSPIQNPTACLNKEVCFYVEVPPEATGFNWITPSTRDATVNKGGTPNDTFICIYPRKLGTFFLRGYSIYECNWGREVIFRTDVKRIESSINKIICPGEIYTSNGFSFDSAGVYQFLAGTISLLGCDSLINLDLKIADTSAVSIECTQDTFLNVLGINWNRRLLADQYEIYINDSLVSVQDYVGHIHFPQFPGEEIDIKIQPISSHGCDYAPGYLTCTAPNLSNSKEIFEKELVSVFPNPSSGVFEVFSEEKIERIEVFDFSGKEVKVVSDIEIDLSEFESGVYFLKIYFEEEVVLKKVMKF